MKKRAHIRKSTAKKSSAHPVPKSVKRHVDAIGKHCDALKKIAHKPRKK